MTILLDPNERASEAGERVDGLNDRLWPKGDRPLTASLSHQKRMNDRPVLVSRGTAQNVRLCAIKSALPNDRSEYSAPLA